MRVKHTALIAMQQQQNKFVIATTIGYIVLEDGKNPRLTTDQDEATRMPRWQAAWTLSLRKFRRQFGDFNPRVLEIGAVRAETVTLSVPVEGHDDGANDDPFWKRVDRWKEQDV